MGSIVSSVDSVGAKRCPQGISTPLVTLYKYTPGKPDLVLAGINAGYNIARDIQYSATLGAVMEASELGIPAIAFFQGDVAY